MQSSEPVGLLHLPLVLFSLFPDIYIQFYIAWESYPVDSLQDIPLPGSYFHEILWTTRSAWFLYDFLYTCLFISPAFTHFILRLKAIF